MAEGTIGLGGGTLIEQAARYWADVRYEDLPHDAVAMAKRFLLDTLAAGIAGAGTEVVQAASSAMRAALEGAGAAGASVIWGQACRLPPVQAALVNGTSAHALELDDFGGTLLQGSAGWRRGLGGVGGRPPP